MVGDGQRRATSLFEAIDQVLRRQPGFRQAKDAAPELTGLVTVEVVAVKVHPQAVGIIKPRLLLAQEFGELFLQ